MNKRIREAYLTALRSGKYKRGEAFLIMQDSRGDRCYCAQGVLCAVADAHKAVDIQPSVRFGGGVFEVAVHPRYTTQQRNGLGTERSIYVGTLGEDLLQNWAGMSPNEQDKFRQVVILNDEEKKTFEEIATYIEENFTDVTYRITL